MIAMSIAIITLSSNVLITGFLGGISIRAAFNVIFWFSNDALYFGMRPPF
jgi:hypothetical protein